MHPERVGPGIVLSKLGEPGAIGLVLRFAREQRVERVARCAQVAFAAERLARGNDRAVRERHGLGPLGAQYRDQQLDFIGIVAGPNTQRVARLV